MDTSLFMKYFHASVTFISLHQNILGILYGVTPVIVHGRLGVTLIHPQVGNAQAFGVEFMITFIVVFTVFANLEPKRSDMGSRSLSIGLAVTLGHLFAVSIVKWNRVA